uniref:Uncharacterized protein n=1 Tax=Arundo donax TaxID=35708 RepID=A0A0A8ZC42_ARUDO
MMFRKNLLPSIPLIRMVHQLMTMMTSWNPVPLEGLCSRNCALISIYAKVINREMKMLSQPSHQPSLMQRIRSNMIIHLLLVVLLQFSIILLTTSQ